MKISDIKKYLIEEKITYKKLSIMSNISEGTLKNIFSGRVPNPRIDTMQAIETALGIENNNYTTNNNSQNFNNISGGINGIINGNITQNSTSPAILTPEEQELIKIFRELSPDKQTAFLKIIK